jgi:hypothetical protein
MVNEKTGEVVNSSELVALIDKNKVDAYKRNFGYYQLVTSELTMDDKEIIDKYHGFSNGRRTNDNFKQIQLFAVPLLRKIGRKQWIFAE